MAIKEQNGKIYPGDERVVMERIYQTIVNFDVSNIAELRNLTDGNLKELGVSNVLELNDIMEKVLVQIFLADLILVYWVPRNEGLRA